MTSKIDDRRTALAPRAILRAVIEASFEAVGYTQAQLMRMFAIVVLSLALFVGCTNTKQVQQDDPKSILRKADSGQEIHGEVGAMYGASTR